MAIVQISRITNRKGLWENLPDPLAGAELGWCTDTRQLFIGNGELADGAPTVGNTEILTEYSDILSFATAYTYTGLDATGYTAQTGPTPGDPITQSLQARLDSYAIVTDFGAVGDGITDCTSAINRALYQLYCVDNNPAVRRGLFFPAGVYLVTGTLLVPSFAMLYGDGINASIISFIVEAWTDTISYQEGVLVSDSGTYYRSQTQVPVGISITDTDYWIVESNPEYIVRTADSQQHIGVDIETNGAVRPQSISITNMSFETNLEIDGLLVEDAIDCEFNTVIFAGPLVAGDLSSPPNIVAVAWASTVSLICQNIKFTGCSYSGFKLGSANDSEAVKGIVFANSKFDTLYQGMYFDGDATGIRVLQNIFDNIYNEGVVFDGISLNSTGYNIFYDVANALNGVLFPVTEIIRFTSDNNLSIGDMFERTDAVVSDSGIGRISIQSTTCIATDNTDSLLLGSYIRKSGKTTVLTNNAVDITLFTVDSVEIRAFNFNYTITRDTYVRTGIVTVVASSDGVGTDLIIDDSGFQNNGVTGVGVTFNATETGGVITVTYSTTNTGVAPVLYYSVTQLA